MTNLLKHNMVTAINEYYDFSNIEAVDEIGTLDEALDYMSYDEILRCYFDWYIAEYDCLSYPTILNAIEEFFELYPKTNDELNIY